MYKNFKKGAGLSPCSLMVAMVTLAADREWTFLCRKHEEEVVVVTTDVHLHQTQREFKV